MAQGGWVYVMTNRPGGTLYVGVTADVAARVYQHKIGEGSAFCRRYNLTRLVYAEEYSTIIEAITREKAIKAWKREWKVALIEAGNPNWEELPLLRPCTPPSDLPVAPAPKTVTPAKAGVS